MTSEDDGYDPYRALFERSQDAILIIEGDRFIDCNESAVRMFRAKSREHILTTHPSELSPPTQEDGRASRDKADEMIARAFEKGVHRFEWMHRRSDETDFLAEVSLTYVHDSSGRDTLHSVVRDISDRRRLEEELRHTQKMEALGKLAGGIAHDFNNLLVAILGHAELLALELGNEKQLARLRQIRSAGERAADLVRELLIFGRKDERKVVVFDLRDLLTESRELLERLIGEDVRLSVDVGGEGCNIEADRAQIQQIVLNLVSNARDAMPHGGGIDIRLRRAEEPGWARLRVRDTGHGMDEATLARVFEPFYTTKEVGKGTGLGLATVHGVVERAGGRISVESAPDVGTEFEILLPTTEARAEVHPSVIASVGGGHETILVVEDDGAVSSLIVETLSGAGYAVIHAQDGLEALGHYAHRHEEIALVLSDVIMPGMSGPELLRRLEAEGRRPRCLLMSGYTGDAIERSGVPEGVELLSKPFAPSTLLTEVRRALDG